MTVTVEANSLSDITQIASNPPRFPRNPAEIPRRPLTLYIARVPGSNDIILTTLKPLTTNVTAQDVISSLYYFHVNSDKDIQPSPKCSPKFGNSVDPALPKKKTFSIRRKPVPGSEHSTSTQPSSSTDQTIPRHSLGPRAISSVSTIDRKPVPGAYTQNTEVTQTTSHADNPQYQNHEFTESDPSSALKYKKSDRDFSVTIIRRDPPSGAQWNIGTVSGYPIIEEAPNGRHSSRSTKKPYYDISLSLKTPGYARFREQFPIIDQTQNQSSNPNEKLHQEISSTFDRRITMEGTSFWNRASAQRKRAMSDFSDKYRNSRGLRAQENDHYQHDVKAHGKGYVFMSPWGGRCKFVTGSGGRSLRCHHKLPSPISANSMDLQQQSVTISELRFNLPISLLAYSTSPQSIDRKSDFFSESQYKDVRNRMSILKLTGPPLTHRTRSNSGIKPRSDDEGNLLRTFSRTSTDSREKPYFEGTETSRNSLELVHHNSKEEVTSMNHLDLGREKAGGGSNGKHAKLGKIIIHDEGIKMLDLIISANMAIWWSVWDGF